MKNLFEFATKELSQDAFLSWFIANCNEPEISKYSYDFINMITGYHFKVGDIKEVEIKQQEHDMDIVVDFWTNKEKIPESHYVIVIEDKTKSSAHSNQLDRYSKIIDAWNKDEEGHNERTRRVFYKVDYLTEADNEEIKFANKDRTDGLWKSFNIKDIYEFFSRITSTKSDILNDYVEHIKTLHKDLTVVSPNDISEWNYTNYQTFFKQVIEKEFIKKGYSFHFETWLYQGRLVSAAFYYYPDKENKRLNLNVTEDYPSFAYPLLEFVYKKNAESITVYSHVTFHWKDGDKDKWSWKHSLYEPSKENAKDFINQVADGLKSIPNIKIRNMDKPNNQTISTDSINLNQSNEHIEEDILSKLDTYFKIFKEVDKKYR